MSQSVIRQRALASPPSRRFFSFFSGYLRWYVPRAFHAVRLARAHRFPQLSPDVSTIVCVNHPSWWDPLICMLLSQRVAPQAEHYAPMDAAMLAHYGFMRRLGLFPVNAACSRDFLRTAESILSRPRSMLWITPEGQFTDARTRPAVWRPGVAAVVARQVRAVVVPLALEYSFWNERLPEALAMVGEPVEIEGRAASAAHWQSVMTEAMTRAQDELAALSMARNPAAFETVFEGGRGFARTYDLWKRLEARWRGQPYIAEHGRLPRA
jgi:1-acyl-sn-glycerol-3-phosphate acyltransferase